MKKLLLTSLLAFSVLSANSITGKVKDASTSNTHNPIKKEKHKIDKTLKKEKRKLKHEKIKMEAKAVTKIL